MPEDVWRVFAEAPDAGSHTHHGQLQQHQCQQLWSVVQLHPESIESMCEKSHARVKSKTLRPGLLESCEGFRMLDNHSANVKAETVCAQMIFGYKGKDLNTSSSPRVQHIPTSFQFGLNQLLQMLCWRRWFWGYLEEKKLKNNGKQNDDQSWRLARWLRLVQVWSLNAVGSAAGSDTGRSPMLHCQICLDTALKLRHPSTPATSRNCYKM